MRKYVTTAAAALMTATIAFAVPASADHLDNRGPYGQGSGQVYDRGSNYDQGRGQNYGNGYGQTDDDDNYGQTYGQVDPRSRDRGFDRFERGFDNWERGWNRNGFNEFRHNQPLNYWKLVRRLERQGYYGVRGLRPARWGWGWRAFAYVGRGRPVMLRINPYTGRVLEARYV